MQVDRNFPPGIIRPDELYTLDTFKQLVGVNDATLRSARRQGLKVSYAHKRGFILGQDWIDYVRSVDQKQKPGFDLGNNPERDEGKTRRDSW